MNANYQMFVPYRNNCYEVFGFDIMIDDTLKPWLLEVNLAPAFSCSSPLDKKIKSSLVQDTLNLIGVLPLELRNQGSKYERNINNKSLPNNNPTYRAYLSRYSCTVKKKPTNPNTSSNNVEN